MIFSLEFFILVVLELVAFSMLLISVLNKLMISDSDKKKCSPTSFMKGFSVYIESFMMIKSKELLLMLAICLNYNETNQGKDVE